MTQIGVAERATRPVGSHNPNPFDNRPCASYAAANLTVMPGRRT